MTVFLSRSEEFTINTLDNKQPTETESSPYRAFVGPSEKYDIMSAIQFNLATSLGLRENHHFLDIGCGSLRLGRLLIPYLQAERYFGIEPEEWLIRQGIENELGQDIIRLKQPQFSHDTNFTLSIFAKSFDFLMAQSIFSHTTPAQTKRCLAEARAVMTKTSIFIATFMKGSESYTGTSWVYPKCVTYREEDIVEWVEEVGLRCKITNWSHPNGQTWMIIYDEGNTEFINNWASQISLEQYAALRRELQENKEKLQKFRGHFIIGLGLKLSAWFRKRKLSK